ncbi:MAG: tail protein [Bacteriophage sp.]|nr:MAG: tail protein [Bacteriophage sp.]
MFKLKFNGVEAPKFIKVTGVDMGALPSISHNTFKVPSHFGDIDCGVDIGGRVITVNIKVIKDLEKDDSYYIRELAKWLRGDNFKVSKLELDESGRYYMARCSDNVELKDTIVISEGHITFTASDPRCYGKEELHRVLRNGESIGGNAYIEEATRTVTYPFEYRGDLTTLPTINIKFSGDCNSVRVTHVESGLSNFVTKRTFKSGDTLMIDNDRKLTKLNNRVDMTIFDITADFIELKEGRNTLKFVFDGVMANDISFTFTNVYF